MPQEISEWPALSRQVFLQEEDKVEHAFESFLDQGDRGTCGAISVLHAMGKEKVEALAEDIYKEPECIPDDLIEGNVLKREKHPLALILATHLLNERHRLWTYHGTGSEKDAIAEAASSSDIKKWLLEYFPDREIASYSSYCFGAWDNAQEVNVLWGKSQKPVVIAFVNLDYLQKNDAVKLPSLLAAFAEKGHCVHITTPFVQVNNCIQFDAFTWGKIQTFTMSKSDFKGMMWEMIVAK